MCLAVCNPTFGNITTHVQSLHQEGRCVKDSLLGPQDAYRYVECPNHDETLTFGQIFGLSLTGLRPHQTHQQLVVLLIKRPGLCWRFRRFDRTPKRYDKQNELNIGLARTHELTISASSTTPLLLMASQSGKTEEVAQNPIGEGLSQRSGCPALIFSYFLSVLLFSPIFKLKPPIFPFFQLVKPKFATKLKMELIIVAPQGFRA